MLLIHLILFISLYDLIRSDYVCHVHPGFLGTYEFCILEKGYTVPGNQGTYDKLNPTSTGVVVVVCGAMEELEG